MKHSLILREDVIQSHFKLLISVARRHETEPMIGRQINSMLKAEL